MKRSQGQSALRKATRIGFALVIALVVAAYDSFFTVEEGAAVVVTRLGRPVREVLTAGPYWKLPAPIDELHVVDRRRRVFVTPESATYTRDKKNIVLTTYVVWHVESPLIYLQSVADSDLAEASLAGMISAARAQRIGQYDLTALVSTDPAAVHVEAIESEIAADVATTALEKMGVGVDQVGIQRIAFPEENLDSVFERMRIERRAEANRLRAEGAKAAQAIRDDAHVRSQEILRAGREEASQIAAEAERQAALLLAQSHQKNPEFYRFWSALQASKRVLKERATLILSSDELFFDGLISPVEGSPVRRAETKSSPRNLGADDLPELLPR